MSRIALIAAAAVALAGCATGSPYGYGGGTMSAQDVNCGAGVLGGAVLGGLAGNQIGKGQGQDLATIAGATVGGLMGATRQQCQPQAYGQPVYAQPVYAQPGYGRPQPVLAGYDRYGRPVYR
jgi:outer membrane lipoprotein SlyB